MKTFLEFKTILVEKTESEEPSTMDAKLVETLIKNSIGGIYKEKVLEFFVDNLSGDPSLSINYFSSKKTDPISSRNKAKNRVAILVEFITDKKAKTEMVNANFSGINSKQAKRMKSKTGTLKDVANHIIKWFKEQKKNIFEE